MVVTSNVQEILTNIGGYGGVHDLLLANLAASCINVDREKIKDQKILVARHLETGQGLALCAWQESQ